MSGVLILLVFAYPRINYCPKIVTPSKKINNLFWFMLYSWLQQQCSIVFLQYLIYFVGYLTNLSQLR
jgi:hypothetical protein